MNWLIFYIGGITLIVSFLTGVYIGKKSITLSLKWSAVALLFVLIKMIFLNYPEIEFKFLNNNWYSYIRFWWIFPFTLLVLGISVFRVKLVWLRVTSEIISGLLILFFCMTLYFINTFDYDTLKGQVNSTGICMQTFSYSCGAAAAVTLLNQYDIRISEKEMAVLCGTNKYTGTDEFKICRGLRKKINDNNVKVILERMEWDDIKPSVFPFIAVIKIVFMSDHWVVIMSKNNESLKVYDPFVGIYDLRKKEFLKVWRKTVVRLEGL